MGRPPLDSPKKQYTVMLEPQIVEEIDRIAKKVGISRSHLMKNMIEVGLDSAKVYESLGIISAVSYGRKIVDWFKKSKEEGKIIIGQDGDFKIIQK